MFKDEIRTALVEWVEAWNAHDLDGVMSLLHDEVVFENWDGDMVCGKRELRRAWSGWFGDHGEFRFITEEIFIDEETGKVLFMWTLEWPSREKSFEGEGEKRRGVDVLHFNEDKIIRKMTYSKTSLEIGGKKVRLRAEK